MKAFSMIKRVETSVTDAEHRPKCTILLANKALIASQLVLR